jgi:hypothetical protein
MTVALPTSAASATRAIARLARAPSPGEPLGLEHTGLVPGRDSTHGPQLETRCLKATAKRRIVSA